MAKQSINTIKQWFKTGLKPTQQQFWDWLDSYRHKDDKVLATDIDGLQELLDTKVDKKDFVEPEIWDNTKAYVFDAEQQQYVSYSNPASEDPQFKSEGFYRLLADTNAGESPETHPAKWVYQGQTMGDISIEDVVGLIEVLNDKVNEAPADGKQYARKDTSWVEIEASKPSTLTLKLSTNPTYNSDNTIKILKQEYISDPTKYYEQRFEYTDGVITKIELKDDINSKWIQKTNLYSNGLLIKPTIIDITDWTII